MRSHLRPLALALALGLTPACQTPQADTAAFTVGAPVTAASGSTGSPDTSTGASSGSAGSTSELSTGSASDGMSSGTTLILDVGSDQDLGDGKPVGCQGKIDFLFVISRWAGMEYFQTQLLAALPKFIETIEAKFADFDYHIMVVDSDPYWGLGACDEMCPEQCVPDYPCDYVPTACDTSYGGGVVFPAGVGASNKPCNIDGGRRYMQTGQTDLKETFACVAQVGSSGYARVAQAMTAALESNINDPGGCNPGFLRKDALLMVTLISNTYDQEAGPNGSTGSPETWTEAVRKAKGGDLASVVMFSILRAYPECYSEDRTCQMVKMFPYWLLADRDEDYGPRFDEATELVEAACAGFVVPG